MLSEGIGLTSLYNRVADPSAQAHQILELRQLHQQLDTAVAASYGWSDLELTMDFTRRRRACDLLSVQPHLASCSIGSWSSTSSGSSPRSNRVCTRKRSVRRFLARRHREVGDPVMREARLGAEVLRDSLVSRDSDIVSDWVISWKPGFSAELMELPEPVSGPGPGEASRILLESDPHADGHAKKKLRNLGGKLHVAALRRLPHLLHL